MTLAFIVGVLILSVLVGVYSYINAFHPDYLGCVVAPGFFIFFASICVFMFSYKSAAAKTLGEIPFILCWGAIFCIGIYWFLYGFWNYRKHRMLEDTPEARIRGVALGFVRIHGKARPSSDPLLSAPVTKTPCLFYKVDILTWVNQKEGGRWDFMGTDVDGSKFYLEDATGKILVDAHDAQLDLIQSGQRETGNPRPAPKGGDSISNILENIAASLKVPPPDPYVASVAAKHRALPHWRSDPLSYLEPSGRHRFTEYCILPDHWYDVTGTCVENPNFKGEDDRKMIAKGTTEPTFLVSWRSASNVNIQEQKRAMKYILGGGALAIFSVGGMLYSLGLL